MTVRLILLLNCAVPAAVVIERRMRWDYDQLWWVNEDLEGDGHDLIQGTIMAFSCRKWEKPQQTWDSNRAPPAL